MARTFFKSLIVGLMLAGLTSDAWACSVCFGDPNSKITRGIFAAVYVLLGAVLFVLGGIACTAWSWSRRAKNMTAKKG